MNDKQYRYIKNNQVSKMDYPLNQSHALVKPYYFNKYNKNYHPSGNSRNGSLFRSNNDIYCLVNLVDFMLPIIEQKNINYNNAEINNYLTPYDLQVDVNYFGNTFINILHYESYTNVKYLIISTYHSIEIFKIESEYTLTKKYTYIFCYPDLDREMAISHDYLYSSSIKGLTMISLRDIDNIHSQSHIDTDIILKGTICCSSVKIYTGLKIDCNRKLMYLYNDTKIYIYNIEIPGDPIFINSKSYINIINISIINLTGSELNNINYSNDCLDRYFIFVTTTDTHYILDTTILNNIKNVGKSNTYINQDSLNQIIYIGNNFFMSTDYKQVNQGLSPTLDIFSLTVLDSLHCTDLDINPPEKALYLSYIKSINLENNNSLIGDMEYIEPNLYIKYNTNGIIKYNVSFCIGLNNINITEKHMVNSFLYFKDLLPKGARDFIKIIDSYYLLDSCNGLVIYNEKEYNNNIKSLVITADQMKSGDETKLLKLPDKIFIHLDILYKETDCTVTHIEFETDILAIDRQAKTALLYVPTYILANIKPYELDDKQQHISLQNYSYGLNNDIDMKRNLTNVNVLNTNSDVYTPVYKNHQIESINNNKFGYDIHTNINLSGCIIINDDSRPITFIRNEIAKSLNINIIFKMYKNYREERKLYNSTLDFNGFGKYKTSSLIIKGICSNSCVTESMRFFTVENRCIYITHKNNLKNIKTNIVYKVVNKDNCLIGFTRIRSIKDIKNLTCDIPDVLFKKDYLYLDIFYKTELNLLNGIIDVKYWDIQDSLLCFIEEPITYIKTFKMSNTFNKIMLDSYYLNIDIINLNLLNHIDLGVIIEDLFNNKFLIHDFINYKSSYNIGCLITKLSNEFIKENNDILKLGDIIYKINGSSQFVYHIVYGGKSCKSVVEITFYRLTNKHWCKHQVDVKLLKYKTIYNNLVI